MLNFNGQCHPYLTDFLEMVKIAAISGRYHRDMKILKILASNFKQIDDDRRVGRGQSPNFFNKFKEFEFLDKKQFLR